MFIAPKKLELKNKNIRKNLNAIDLTDMTLS